MNAFELVATISLDTNKYENQLDTAGHKTTNFGDKLKNGLAVAGKIAAASIAAVTAATTALSASVFKGVTDLAAYGDNIDKMSQKMGMSARAYQEWDAIMQHSGTSIGALQSGMKTLANAAESGNTAFARLGISMEDVALMDNEQLFYTVITALQNVENETTRTYLAGQLLGRGATELGALLNTSAEDMDAMRRRVHELGGVMSNEAVKAAAAFQDSLQDLQTSFSGIGRSIFGEFLPSITEIMDGLTMIFAGEDGGLEKIKDGVDGFINNLNEAIPRMMEIGGKIVSSIGKSILENLPSIISAGTDILIQLSYGIISALPQIAESAIEIIATLASSLSEALPELIPAAISAILQFAETLLDNADKILEAGMELIVSLAEGIADALPEFIEKAPEIITKLMSAIRKMNPKLAEAGFKIVIALAGGILESLPQLILVIPKLLSGLVQSITDGLGSMADAGFQIIIAIGEGIDSAIQAAGQWGKDLIDNFVDGIKKSIGKVVDSVKNVANTIASYLGFSEPDKGPLSNFHTYAPDMMQLFAKGITENEGLLKSAFDDALSFGIGTPDFNLNAGFSYPTMPQPQPVGGVPANQSGDIVINITETIDGEILSRRMFRYNRAESERIGAAMVQ